MKYYVDDEDVCISRGVGVECLLEGVGESPREAIFALLTVDVGCVGGDLDPFVLFVGCCCCCLCYIHR